MHRENGERDRRTAEGYILYICKWVRSVLRLVLHALDSMRDKLVIYTCINCSSTYESFVHDL